MKEKRLRRNADHLPAGVKLEESFDERGKRHISIVATQGSPNFRDIASLRPADLKVGRIFASSDDVRSGTQAVASAGGISCGRTPLTRSSVAATNSCQTQVSR